MNTKKMLFDAFYELMQERDFDDITVQMVVERAQVSRGTFYRHYDDKYDLMNSFYRNDADALIAKFDAEKSTRGISESIFQHIKQNKRYYQNAVKTEGMDSFLDFLKKHTASYFASKYMEGRGVDKLAPETELEIEMLCAGYAGVLRKWIERDFPISSERLALMTQKLISDDVREAVSVAHSKVQAKEG